jgi:hypothetical protein
VESACLNAQHAAECTIDALLTWVSASQAATVILQSHGHSGVDHPDRPSVEILEGKRDRSGRADHKCVYDDARDLLRQLQPRCERHGLSCSLGEDGASVCIIRLK